MQKRIFIGSALAVFLIMTLQHLQLSPTSFLSPVPPKDAALETIRPQLEKYKNTFFLKKQTSFIAKTHAAGEYENAASYAVIDLATGEVIRDKALTEEIPIASLTKIMTSLIALDLTHPNDLFTVTDNAAEQIPTKIGARPGEQLTIHELLEATMLTSANDAAQTINDGINAKYGEKLFVKAMNAKAAFLGLSKTHFTNPQGFDNPYHYSSAKDLAVLTQYALTHYPEFAEIVKKDYVFLPENAYHKQYDLYNWNGLLGVYPNISGVKIGNTDDAGKTTLVVSEREGKSLLAVVLGAPSIMKRDLWASQLLDAGFEETMGLRPIAVTEEALQAKYATWKYFD